MPIVMDIPNPEEGYNYRYVHKSRLVAAIAKGFENDPSGKQVGDAILMRRRSTPLPTLPEAKPDTPPMRTVPKSREGVSNA